MRKLLIFIAVLASLNGCASVDRLPFVHRIDIQQGNVIEQETVNQLRPGMTRRQVRYIMGTPLLVDTFHQDRWEYLYRMQPGDGELEKQRLTLFFQDDKLVEIQGTVKPDPTASQETEASSSRTVVVPRQERQPEGILTRFWNWITFKKPEEF